MLHFRWNCRINSIQGFPTSCGAKIHSTFVGKFEENQWLLRGFKTAPHTEITALCCFFVAQVPVGKVVPENYQSKMFQHTSGILFQPSGQWFLHVLTHLPYVNIYKIIIYIYMIIYICKYKFGYWISILHIYIHIYIIPRLLAIYLPALYQGHALLSRRPWTPLRQTRWYLVLR